MSNLSSEEYERRIRWQNEEVDDRETRMDIMREGILVVIDKAVDELEKEPIAVAGADRMEFDIRINSLFKALKSFVDERNALIVAKNDIAGMYAKYEEAKKEENENG